MLYQLILLGVIVGLLLLGAAINVLCWLHIQAFLRDHTAISGHQDFDEFKVVIKVNMYAALAMIVITVATMLTAVVALAMGAVGIVTFVIGMFIFAVRMAVGGMTMKSIEGDLRKVPVVPDLRDEHAYVLKRWTSSALPDW